jgi:hypothetical protein
MASPISPYDPAFDKIVFNCKQAGMTVNEIAEVLGIIPQTFYKWKSKHESFAQAIAEGDEVATKRVEDTLYELAVYGSTTVKTSAQFDMQGNLIGKTVQTIKHPPSLPAVCRWLTVKDKKVWGVHTINPEGDESGNGEYVVEFLPLSKKKNVTE